ncbi:MAG: DUF3786 domain-containing protein [Anaerolineae bacterium]|nr:DUF3786 domain-containing protein [Anaerolineae bacterium]
MAFINLNPALEKARDDFAAGNPEQMAARARVEFDLEAGFFKIPFLGVQYIVTFPGGEVQGPREAAVPIEIRILLLHYLTGASGIPVNGRLISFKELPDGSIYIGPFTQRSINPLKKFFGSNPQAMVEAAGLLGGSRVELGDAAVTIPFFPLIPITYVIWEGDDEFPPSANVLFDSTASAHMATEDYAVMAGMGVFAMKKAAGI